MTTTRLNFTADEPQDDELRRELNEKAAAYQAVLDPNELAPETVAAAEFIDKLMEFAGLEYEEVDPAGEYDEAASDLVDRVDQEVVFDAFLDIAIIVGANKNWGEEDVEAIAKVINEVINEVGLPEVDAVGAPVDYWRRLADHRGIKHDGPRS